MVKLNINQEELKELESSDDDAFYNPDDGQDYKGIFYNEEPTEERYFEYGAHFAYCDLFSRLEKVHKDREESIKRESSSLRQSMHKTSLKGNCF